MNSTRKNLSFRVFVSSTFSDFVLERNALHERVFPSLVKYCQQRGATFQAVDLRWGVAREAALDQQTMKICLDELRNCQRSSPKPNFIILLGDRYGWIPLPRQIESTEYASLVNTLEAHEIEELNQWYRRDENAVPESHILLPRAGRFANHDTWLTAERRLSELLAKAVERHYTQSDPAKPDYDPARDKYFLSATHQEIICGAIDPEQARNATSHVFCGFRTISGLPENDSVVSF
ncbi:MAG: DUF4062 domain-containing protein, partial [Planctomycetaceae bacterium]|nr:DUF4062 domain-containing protein [Planctomycetaceae bacterium]